MPNYEQPDQQPREAIRQEIDTSLEERNNDVASILAAGFEGKVKVTEEIVNRFMTNAENLNMGIAAKLADILSRWKEEKDLEKSQALAILFTKNAQMLGLVEKGV